MYVLDAVIKAFVKKQNLTNKDSYLQAKVVLEEAQELQEAVLSGDEENLKEELADVIIATAVLAEIKDYLNNMTDLIAKKMQVNLKKPIRKDRGKVPKE